MLEGPEALLAWYIWLDSWLRQAGGRLSDPVAYLPKRLRSEEPAETTEPE
jgi:hypothetical protein